MERNSEDKVTTDEFDDISSAPKAKIHKPWWKNVLGWLITEEVGDIKNDIIFPALKDVVYNVITVMIFGEPKARSRKDSYRDYSSRSDFRNDGYSRDYQSREKPKSLVSDYKYVTFPTMRDATDALDKIRAHAYKYGKVSVATFWDILRITNRPNNPIEQHWGWYPEMLDSATCRRNYEGDVTIYFPEEATYF